MRSQLTLLADVKGAGLKGQNRIRLLGLIFVVIFLAIAIKLAFTSVIVSVNETVSEAVDVARGIPRPDIVDRNGNVLATDVAVASLYADPRKILDIEEAVELITAALPDIDAKTLDARLRQKGKAFVWLKRQASPEERDAVFNLGIPGVSYVNERRRVYPQGRLAAHVLGYVDLDSKGIAGIERYLDDAGAIFTASLQEPDRDKAAPAELAIDIRVQHAVADELQIAIEKFKAIAGGGIVMDVETGEILALVSLPDYNPNDDVKRISKDQQNRMLSGVYELGSVIKAVTFAMAFDYGAVTMESRFDARAPLVIGSARINDFHAQRRILSLPEVFTYSSNIGTAKMALEVGVERHREFLERIGLFDKLMTEVPETARPLLPKRWGRLVSATAAFGHGFAVQPLQGLAVVSGLLNGGRMPQPTFLKRSKEEAEILAKQIVADATSSKLRELFRLNATAGSAAKADVIGYRVGGKTGTAEKVVGGRYSSEKRLASFIGAFPMDRPKYAVLVLLDEPKGLPETYGFATSGWNAVPTAGSVIARIAPILGIAPVFTDADREKLAKQAGAKRAG
jgi:cell division protein FtsI (penicillin-binding protein 3)